MKALIQKDLRENLKLALIGLLIFSLLLLQAYQVCSAAVTSLVAGGLAMTTDLQPLLSPPLQMEAAFFCAIFGAALGWLQTRNEAHRDLWAFLIHRPVTRTEIFLGKTIAGLCLYVFGVGLPIAVLIAVVRWPGHVAAPFEWAMVLPLVSIFLTGVAYYFAGVLTGLRQARWYASRGLGLGLAIFASLGLGVTFAEPWQWPVLIVIVVVILATAVWGGYQSGGFYRGQPAIGRLALIVAMTASCGVVFSGGGSLLFSTVLAPLSHPSYEASYYRLATDGGVYKVTMTQDNELGEIVDLEGHPLLDPKTGRKMEFQEFERLSPEGRNVSTTFKQWRQNENSMQFEASHFFTLMNMTDKTIWYLDRHGKLTRYDGRTRKIAGSLDPRGSDGVLKSESFLPAGFFQFVYTAHDEGSWKVLATARAVYRADFKARMLQLIFTLTNGDEIGGYAALEAGRYDSRPNYVIITTRKSVCLLDSAGRTIFSVPYQPGYVEYPRVDVWILQPTNGSTIKFAVWFQPDEEMNQKLGGKMPVHVLWIGPGQTVVKSADLPALPKPVSKFWQKHLAAALLPPPEHLEYEENLWSPWNVVNFVLAFISAGIGWALTRRYSFSTAEGLGWTLFVFLLGITGLLALLCVQEWPARECRPHCKKLRAVDRETCEHCQSSFGPPEKNGTEIFAPLVKAGAAKP